MDSRILLGLTSFIFLLLFVSPVKSASTVYVTNVTDSGQPIIWDGLDVVDTRYVSAMRVPTGVYGDVLDGNLVLYLEDRTSPKALVRYSSISGYSGLMNRTNQTGLTGTTYGHPYAYKENATSYHSWWMDNLVDDASPQVKHYTSADGNAWTLEDSDVIINGSGDNVSSFGLIDVVPTDGGYRMYWQLNTQSGGGTVEGWYQSIHTSTNDDLFGTWAYEGMSVQSDAYTYGFSPTGNVLHVDTNAYLMFLVPESESGMLFFFSQDGVTFYQMGRILDKTSGNRTSMKEGTTFLLGSDVNGNTTTYHFGFLYDASFTGHAKKCLGFSTFDIVIGDVSSTSQFPYEFDFNEEIDLINFYVWNYIPTIYGKSMSINATTTDKVVGSGALNITARLTSGNDTAFEIVSPYISIDENTEYRWSSLTKSTHNMTVTSWVNAGGLMPAIFWYDENYTYLNVSRYVGCGGQPSFYVGTPSNWTMINHTMSSPASAEYMRISYGLDWTDMFAPEYWLIDLVCFAESDKVWVDIDDGSDYYCGTSNYPLATMQKANEIVATNGTIYVNNINSSEIMEEFSGEYTTDCCNITDWENVDLILDETDGMINWSSPINLSGSCFDFCSYIEISHNRISVDIANMPELNQPAILTFKNSGFTDEAYFNIYRNGMRCPDSICTTLSFDGDDIILTVTQMSEYEVLPAMAVLVEAGGGLGSFLTAITSPVILLVLSLGIIGGILAILYSIASTLKRAVGLVGSF